MPGDAETRPPRRPDRPDRWSSLTADSTSAKDAPSSLQSALDNIGESEGHGKRRKRDSNDRDGRDKAYYDISMLKAPVWTPEVGQYFFLGGLSAYAYVLSRLAERLGGPEYRDLTRLGTAVAAAAALPCAPLLIWDLGDRKRFHHMLRVWKPTSPMNLGSWVLSAYTAVGGLVALREVARARRGDRPAQGLAKAGDVAVGVLGDSVGIPLAITLAAYTGVLLSTTATPVWSKNSWIGTLFSASAVATGAGAVRVALEVKGLATGHDAPAATHLLGKVESAAHLTEAVAHVGFLAAAGSKSAPLTSGGQRSQYIGGAVAMGVILPEIVSRLPVPPKFKPWVKIAAGILGLAGGYALRMSFIAAGRPSAEDPDAARANSKAKSPGPWEIGTAKPEHL